MYIDRCDQSAFPLLSVACVFLQPQFPLPIYASTGLVRTHTGTSAQPHLSLGEQAVL